jgi:hypothetical protein
MMILDRSRRGKRPVMLLGAFMVLASAVAVEAGELAGAEMQDVALRPLEVRAPSPATRETCTLMAWGFGGVRSQCMLDTAPVRAVPSGICVTRYGNRTCY